MSANPLLRRPLAHYLLLGVADASSATCFLFLTDNVLRLHGWGATLVLIQPMLILITLPLWSGASCRFGRERILALAYGWQLLVTPLSLLRAMVADAADRDIA